MNLKIMKDKKSEFIERLRLDEKSSNTILKYQGNINNLIYWFENTSQIFDKASLINYKDYLRSKYKCISTINTYIVTTNIFLRYLGKEDLTIEKLKTQCRFSLTNQLTLEEYYKMLKVARIHNKVKLSLVMQTLTNTGIRVGELKYITYEAIIKKIAIIENKKKVREVVIPNNLAALLKAYCSTQKITSGPVFLGGGKNKKPIENVNLWRQLKRLALKAGVNQDKIFPHNFRHLFATVYMKKEKNIFELADILGHSSIETTRIYARTSSFERQKKMSEMWI